MNQQQIRSSKDITSVCIPLSQEQRGECGAPLLVLASTGRLALQSGYWEEKSEYGNAHAGYLLPKDEIKIV